MTRLAREMEDQARSASRLGLEARAAAIRRDARRVDGMPFVRLSTSVSDKVLPGHTMSAGRPLPIVRDDRGTVLRRWLVLGPVIGLWMTALAFALIGYARGAL